MKSWMTSATHYRTLLAFTAQTAYEDAMVSDEEEQLPEPLRDWLGRLRLLYGVPFAYLVPNEKLLPKESIRFFYIDRNWTDRLVDGALSVGKTTTSEYAHHHAVNTMVCQDLDEEEHRVRIHLRGETPPYSVAEAADMTGMLMRSRIVSGWPGLEVKAYKGSDEPKDKLTLLRMDRLAPDVLLCIFSDIPTIVDVEEPREGIQFGVDQGEDRRSYELKLRYVRGPNAGYNVGHSELPQPPAEAPDQDTIGVSVRKANREVIHVRQLAADLPNALVGAGVIDDANDVAPDDPGTRSISPANLAVQMLQFPFRQRFEGAGSPPPDRPDLDLIQVTTIYTAATVKVETVLEDLTEEDVSALLES